MGRRIPTKFENDVETTAKHLCRLNSWHAIVVLCEGGIFSGASPSEQQAIQRVIATCKTQAQRCLDQYEAGRAALSPEIKREG